MRGKNPFPFLPLLLISFPHIFMALMKSPPPGNMELYTPLNKINTKKSLNLFLSVKKRSLLGKVVKISIRDILTFFIRQLMIPNPSSKSWTTTKTTS